MRVSTPEPQSLFLLLSTLPRYDGVQLCAREWAQGSRQAAAPTVGTFDHKRKLMLGRGGVENPEEWLGGMYNNETQTWCDVIAVFRSSRLSACRASGMSRQSECLCT